MSKRRGGYPALDRGYLVRREACRLAAQVMAGRPEDKPAPLLWSLTVFFESYMCKGSEGTAKDFGPRDPVELKAIRG